MWHISCHGFDLTLLTTLKELIQQHWKILIVEKSQTLQLSSNESFPQLSLKTLILLQSDQQVIGDKVTKAVMEHVFMC